MITYKIQNNSIIINNKTTNLPNTVKKVYEYKNILILLLNYKDTSMDNQPNVWAFSSKGIKIWEITPIKDFDNKYLDVIEENENLVFIGSNHFKYVVNAKDGTFIKEKIMPLKNIDDESNTLFTKENAIQLGVVLIIVVIFSISIKNIVSNIFSIPVNFINNFTTEENIENKEIENSELNNLTESIEQEISQNVSIEENVSISEIIVSENAVNEGKEIIQDTQESVEKVETNKYEGIDKFVEITDSIVDAIANGKNTSIKDVNGEISTCTYIETLDSCRIKVNLNETQAIIKLIGIDSKSDCKSQIESFLSSSSTLYIEQDNKKKNSDGEILAYIWLTESKDDKNNMLNYYLIRNDYATFKMQSPNVKYNYYFSK